LKSPYREALNQRNKKSRIFFNFFWKKIPSEKYFPGYFLWKRTQFCFSCFRTPLAEKRPKTRLKKTRKSWFWVFVDFFVIDNYLTMHFFSTRFFVKSFCCVFLNFHRRETPKNVIKKINGVFELPFTYRAQKTPPKKSLQVGGSGSGI
jgi:hypothetical protein